MRKWIMQHTEVRETPLGIDELMTADEVFFTNAIRGIQWVSGIGEKQGLVNTVSGKLYHEIIYPLFD